MINLILSFLAFFPFPSAGASERPLHSLVVIIHGDQNMTYYNKNGDKVRADTEQFNIARSVAINCRSCEVFIFYMQPRGLFRKWDGKALYFKNGTRLGKKSFSRKHWGRDLYFESLFYNKYTSQTENNYLAYFGHQIPEVFQNYNTSYPDEKYSIDKFSFDLSGFRSKFNFIMLSTCLSATPKVLSLLKERSDYLLLAASKISLKFMSINNFSYLNSGPIDQENFYLSILDSSFHRLATEDRTELSLSLFKSENIDTSQNFYSQHSEYLNKNKYRIGYKDCSGPIQGLKDHHFRSHEFLPSKNIGTSGLACAN